MDGFTPNGYECAGQIGNGCHMGIVKASDEAIRGRRAHLGRDGSSPSRPRRCMASAPTRPTAKAVAAIFATKGRPRFNPLIVHVADAGQAAEHAR